MAAPFPRLRESVLISGDRRRLRNWWKDLELWGEFREVVQSDYRRLEELAKDGFSITAAIRARAAIHKRWSNRQYARLSNIRRQMGQIKQRQVRLYTLLREAEGARKRGVAMLDAGELRRIGKRAVKADEAHGRAMNGARWGAKREEAERKRIAKARERALRHRGIEPGEGADGAGV